jgi:hypothetical protein
VGRDDDGYLASYKPYIGPEPIEIKCKLEICQSILRSRKYITDYDEKLHQSKIYYVFQIISPAPQHINQNGHIHQYEYYEAVSVGWCVIP